MTCLLPDNCITSFDFNPNGETIASIDCYGTCVLSDVSTQNCSFYLNMNKDQWWRKQYFRMVIVFNVCISSYCNQIYICSPSNFNSSRPQNFSCLSNSFLDALCRCRWSTNPDEPLLFVKYKEYRGSKLNILDAEKIALTLKDPFLLETGGLFSHFFFLVNYFSLDAYT